MREIKFRAWDKAKKEWIAKDFHLIGEIMMSGPLFDRSLERLNDIEIQQYTGLKDKNGKEIYEGDILVSYDPMEGEKITILEEDGTKKESVVTKEDLKYSERFVVSIEIRNGTLGIVEEGKWYQNEGSFENSEIIGNIYENMELIK